MGIGNIPPNFGDIPRKVTGQPSIFSGQTSSAADFVDQLKKYPNAIDARFRPIQGEVVLDPVTGKEKKDTKKDAEKDRESRSKDKYSRDVFTAYSGYARPGQAKQDRFVGASEAKVNPEAGFDAASLFEEIQNLKNRVSDLEAKIDPKNTPTASNSFAVNFPGAQVINSQVPKDPDVKYKNTSNSYSGFIPKSPDTFKFLGDA